MAHDPFKDAPEKPAAPPTVEPDRSAEAVMRSLWNNLPSDNNYDDGMTLKAESVRTRRRRRLAPSPHPRDAAVRGVCDEEDEAADPDMTMVDPEASREGDGQTGDPDATMTGIREAPPSSSSSSVSSGSATSVFQYKPNSSVILRRSQLVGLGDKAGEEDEPGAEAGDGCDFVIKRPLGRGGMGVVYVARQTSMNRDVAIKMVLPTAKNKAGMANKLISEALVTGELEHPGIVPVHELAHTDDDALFYAMKVVRGVPWSERLPALSERENIDILLRAADALAFAHDKGVLHRDLKPENVMLGDYGEVLLLDWGLAVSPDPSSKAETLSPENAKAGTAGYMAPEMAMGQVERIGPASDIYLLGAVLFEILTGKKPHTGANIFVCLAAAAANIIRETERDDKLMEVARRAMATEPGDRHPSVKAFQESLREVLHNLESVTLSNNARETLEAAACGRDYETFSQAVFAFREARRMWPGNGDAVQGEAEARRRYAACALAKGDYDLAGSALGDLDDPDAEALRERIRKARNDETRRRRMVTVLACAVLVLAACAGAVLHWQRGRENDALAMAADAEENARQALRTHRQFATYTAYVRNHDFIDQQVREGELVGAIADLRRTALAAAAGKPGAPLPDEAERHMARLVNEARSFSRNADWGFDPAAARRLRAEAAEALGVPEGMNILLDGDGDGEEDAAIGMSLIPAGRFVMGRTTNYRMEGDPDEYPHFVKLSKPFYMGTTEVTRGAWRAAVGVEWRSRLEQFFYSDAFAGEISEEEFNNSEWAKWGWRTRPLQPGEENLPATGVSWNDINDIFLPAIRGSVPEGWTAVLPTEAQWEYACRAGEAAPFHSGDGEEALARVGWYKGSGVDGPRPVAGLEPNAWGLYDMHGNVDELVMDSYIASYYLISPVDDPVFDGAEFFRVMRGGNWQFEPSMCSSSYRDYLYWDSRAAVTGFRLALVPAGTAVPKRADDAKPRELIPTF